jgi:hypothetical protein
MQYLLLIYENEKHLADVDPESMKQLMADYGAFTEAIKTNDNWVAGEALHPTSTATTVRVRDGNTLKTDGPFAETKEQLGGFYLVEAADLDEAIAIAARIPTARHGCIEVRPIMDFSNYTPG